MRVADLGQHQRGVVDIVRVGAVGRVQFGRHGKRPERSTRSRRLPDLNFSVHYQCSA